MVTCANCGAGNAEGHRFCGNCGSLLDQARIEGERKFASFLFADVAQSTSIAEEMDPEDWTLVMNGAFGFMNAAVSRYGGTVSRLMGDAVLALFGAPVAHEDDAERAVRAALEIQEAAATYAQNVQPRYGIDFRLRVGIHTGTAVLAIVGDAIKAEYTAMGDAANVAARLQSAAEPGTVLISADTQRLVRAQFEFRPRGAIAMKGKQAAVDSFEVVGVRAVPLKARGLEGLTSPIVGREHEVALMRNKLLGLGKGLGSVVAVVGEAGLGKSRLMADLRDFADEQGAPAWYESRAISYGQSIPYYPWRQLGRQMLGASEMEAAPAVREKLAAFVQRLGLPTADIPFYETLLAVDTEESRLALADLSGDDMVNRVAGAVVNAVKAAIGPGEAPRPHVLVFDDLHWSDNATLELIAQVAALASFMPLIIVCILRPRRKAPSWQLVDRLQASLGSTFERIELEPLTPADAGALLGNLLDIKGLPGTVRQRILDRSEGNPFYLEEVLRSLIDCGQIVSEDGHWRATRDIVDAKIPETLAGVLSARIDRLPETTKRVAQTAAVIGRAFMHRVLESVCHAAPAAERIEHVEPHIASLSYEQLVRERTRDPEREYVFKHVLICEAAYGLLLRSRRRDLHARTGLALEELFSDRREEMAAVLAHHFTEAEDHQRALDYSRRAAESAGKLAAPQEELEHRERILKLLDGMPNADPAMVIDATLAWTGVRNILNDFTDVLKRLERAVELSRATADEKRLAIALSWTGNIHMVTGFPSRSFAYLEESQKLATKLGQEQLLLLPLFLTTWFLVDRDPRAAVDALAEVIKLAHEQHALDVEGHAMGVRAIALARLGEFEQARKQIADALEVAKRVGSRVKDADIHISASMAYYDMGEIEKGLEHARIGAEKALSVNGFECACAGFYNVGRGHLERHELDKALSELGRSLKIAELATSTGMAGLATIARGEVAVAQFEQGTAEAVDRLRAAMNEAQAGQNEYGAFALGQRLAAALLKLGRHEEALALLEKAIAYYRERSMRPYLANALELLVQVHQKAGRPEAAAQAREEAATLRRTLEPPPEAQPVPSLAAV
jgi:class 3 adenylate cyclase/tetratricopeptide (TPR) repeat protein